MSKELKAIFMGIYTIVFSVFIVSATLAQCSPQFPEIEYEDTILNESRLISQLKWYSATNDPYFDLLIEELHSLTAYKVISFEHYLIILNEIILHLRENEDLQLKDIYYNILDYILYEGSDYAELTRFDIFFDRISSMLWVLSNECKQLHDMYIVILEKVLWNDEHHHTSLQVFNEVKSHIVPTHYYSWIICD